MKKITTMLALCTLFSGSAFAQDNSKDRNQPPCRSNQEMAWGTGLAALAVLGVVVGLTASQSTNSSTTSK
jgi:hypothetical protein